MINKKAITSTNKTDELFLRINRLEYLNRSIAEKEKAESEINLINFKKKNRKLFYTIDGVKYRVL